MEDYVPCIDQEDDIVCVVIHIYDTQIESSRIVNRFLTHLSQKYIYTKFARIQSYKADVEFDRVAYPVLLVYRGGKLIKTLLRMTAEIGK